MILGIQKWHR